MTKLIIFPTYDIGPNPIISCLDVHLLSDSNIFNTYARDAGINMNTIEILYNYFNHKSLLVSRPTTISQSQIKSNIIITNNTYKHSVELLFYVFFKIITEYQITAIEIYSSHFIDIYYDLYTHSKMPAKLITHNSKCKLLIDASSWHSSYHRQIQELGNQIHFKDIIMIGQLKPENKTSYTINMPPNYVFNASINYFDAIITSPIDIEIQNFFNSICDSIASITTIEIPQTLTIIINLDIYLYTNVPDNYLYIIQTIFMHKTITEFTEHMNKNIAIKKNYIDLLARLLQFKLYMKNININYILIFNTNYNGKYEYSNSRPSNGPTI